MRRERQNDLLTLVQSFFRNYLEGMRGASGHTIRAYRDTLRLFFLFLAQRRGGSAANLTLDCFKADAVLAFLDHLQSRRGNSAATRNCRLTVLRSFARHNPRSPFKAGDSPRSNISRTGGGSRRHSRSGSAFLLRGS